MRRFSNPWALVLLLAAACGNPPARTAPGANRTLVLASMAGTYSVRGAVFDTGRRPIREAHIEVIAPGFGDRFVKSDNDGRYEIGDLAGGVRLRASKTGYFAGVHGIRSGGGIFDFVLQPIDWIIPGRPVRTTLSDHDPVCATELFGKDEAGAQDTRCHRFLLEVSTDGALFATLTSTDGPLALAIVSPDGREAQSVSKGHQTRTTLSVDRGVTYEIRVLGHVDGPLGTPFQIETLIE